MPERAGFNHSLSEMHNASYFYGKSVKNFLSAHATSTMTCGEGPRNEPAANPSHTYMVPFLKHEEK